MGISRKSGGFHKRKCECGFTFHIGNHSKDPPTKCGRCEPRDGQVSWTLSEGPQNG